ncbi:hypothetical protein [Spirulina subsalsa]|nr:hypothetical protein [Spirulina subsalsa]
MALPWHEYWVALPPVGGREAEALREGITWQSQVARKSPWLLLQ